jgi:hypothetical protein
MQWNSGTTFKSSFNSIQSNVKCKSRGLYYKTITIIIMTIVVMLQIVASLTIVIDDTS